MLRILVDNIKSKLVTFHGLGTGFRGRLLLALLNLLVSEPSSILLYHSGWVDAFDYHIFNVFTIPKPLHFAPMHVTTIG